MTLTDAGPLVALMNRREESHEICAATVASLPRSALLTTWPCFTEAMYLLGAAGGYPYQAALWRMRAGGRLALRDLTSIETDRAAALMEKYRDTPMDLADASLVAVAESLGVRQVFTLDRHFRIYRLANGSALEPIPG